MGATDDAILRIFLYQGGIIGGAGTALGLAHGHRRAARGSLVYAFPLDPKVYFISRLPVKCGPRSSSSPACVAIVICLVATVFPALYAASLRPADGLRAQ